MNLIKDGALRLSVHLLVTSSPSAGPSGLSLEEQRALLREEQLRHVADLMESDEDELLVQALDEVERWLAFPMDDENLHVTEHRQRLHDNCEAFACQNAPSFFEEAPAQVGRGGHFCFGPHQGASIRCHGSA